MDAIHRVMNRLPELDAHDAQLIASEARRLLTTGWSVADVVAYLRCLECVSPDLDEDVALERMSLIRRRYEQG